METRKLVEPVALLAAVARADRAGFPVWPALPRLADLALEPQPAELAQLGIGVTDAVEVDGRRVWLPAHRVGLRLRLRTGGPRFLVFATVLDDDWRSW